MSTFVTLVPGAVASEVQSRAKGLASSGTVRKLYSKYNLVPSERGRWGEGGTGSSEPRNEKCGFSKGFLEASFEFQSSIFCWLGSVNLII